MEQLRQLLLVILLRWSPITQPMELEAQLSSPPLSTMVPQALQQQQLLVLTPVVPTPVVPIQEPSQLFPESVQSTAPTASTIDAFSVSTAFISVISGVSLVRPTVVLALLLLFASPVILDFS